MITGGVKFFYQSYALFKNGADITASTNQGAARYVLDSNKYTQWISIGSNDATTETLTIDLDTTRTIDRILLTEMNFKNFEIKYWNGSSFVAFSSVIGVNGQSYTGINVTNYSYDSAYFEFASVSTSQIRITCLSTQTTNAQKFLTMFIATAELGTFRGFPRIDPKTDLNEVKTKALGGKVNISKGFETVIIKANFKTHPYQEDVTLLETLFSSVDPFLIYLCGGRTGVQYFKISQKIWKLSDIYTVQASGDLPSEFEKGVYILGVNKNITFEEHI